MMKKAVDIIFSAVVIAALMAGLLVALFVKKDINVYENRMAETFLYPSAEGYMSGEFQNRFDVALSDRVYLAEDMKKAYNDTLSKIRKGMIAASVGKDGKARYIKIGDKSLFGDNIVFNPSRLEWNAEKIKKRAQMYNALIKNHPDKEFYLYYVEKDTDINFETGEKIGFFEYLCNYLLLDEDKISRFEVKDFEDFKKKFYRTDHHWNHKGADEAYRDLLKLLKVEDEPLEVKSEIKISDSFKGSKATGKAGAYSEEFWAYVYDSEDTIVTLNGTEYPHYGKRDEYNSGVTDKNNVTYTEYYGYDEAEVKIDTPHDDKDNLLIIGESYDNSVLTLLAHHFNVTCSVDLRGYIHTYKSFSLSEYIEKNDIDKVLFMGNLDYIVLDSFIVED